MTIALWGHQAAATNFYSAPALDTPPQGSRSWCLAKTGLMPEAQAALQMMVWISLIDPDLIDLDLQEDPVDLDPPKARPDLLARF